MTLYNPIAQEANEHHGSQSLPHGQVARLDMGVVGYQLLVAGISPPDRSSLSHGPALFAADELARDKRSYGCGIN